MRAVAWPWQCCVLVCLAAAARGVAHVRCPPEAGARCRAPPTDRYGERNFYVDGKSVVYDYQEGAYFGVECPEGVALDEPALPRFEPTLLVGKATLDDCAPGPRGYGAALAARGVRVARLLTLHNPTRTDATLTRAALRGLEDLPRFYLQQLRLERGLLASLTKASWLRLEDVPLEPSHASELPTTLETLTLVRTGLRELSREQLARLSRLRALTTRSPDAPMALDASGAPRLEDASATDAAWVAPALPASLVNLTLSQWRDAAPPAWSACAGLERLEVLGASLRALPPRWLAPCARLARLRVVGARNLSAVAPDALAGAPLQELTLRGTALATLPAELLLGAASLLRLDLSDSRLTELPSFAGVGALLALDASRNALRSDALVSAGGLPRLRELRLAGNAALDACPGALALGGAASLARSALHALRELRVLDLSGSATRRVCSDWRHSMPHLTSLLLRDTNLTALTREDLDFDGFVNVTVDARGAAAAQLAFAENDAEPGRAGPRVTLCLSVARCDCRGHWAARALRAAGRLRLAGPQCGDDSPPCEDGRPWASVPPEDMACPVGAPLCPAGCTCAATPARVLRVSCSGLQRVPLLAPLPLPPPLPQLRPREVELLLAGNRVARLRAEDLSSNVTVLDLRNNSLEAVDEAAATAPLRPRTLLLAGNRLRCTCEDGGAVAALAAPGAVADRGHVQCASGATLAQAAAALPAQCASPLQRALPLGLGLGLLALAAAVGALLLRPEARARLKRLLGGVKDDGPPSQEKESEEEAALPYDVFVSFAHEDEAVASQLVQGLESGPAPLRACVHQRDWLPGGWIPQQIAASVRASRRTLLLVSEAWLASSWARAEFREAHALSTLCARPRLLLVFLADPASLPLDEELRAHAAARTYVVWGEPYFWSKLRGALPAPGGATAPPPRPDPPPPPPG